MAVVVGKFRVGPSHTQQVHGPSQNKFTALHRPLLLTAVSSSPCHVKSLRGHDLHTVYTEAGPSGDERRET
jgi:hypothetical protein